MGNDVLGQQTLRVFQNEGIETSYIALDNETPSGVALISVDQYAENCIVVASGLICYLDKRILAVWKKRCWLEIYY